MLGEREVMFWGEVVVNINLDILVIYVLEGKEKFYLEGYIVKVKREFWF